MNSLQHVSGIVDCISVQILLEAS